MFFILKMVKYNRNKIIGIVVIKVDNLILLNGFIVSSVIMIFFFYIKYLLFWLIYNLF